MLKPALKLVVRLLPCLAAMMASVAIGASTPAPREDPQGARQESPASGPGDGTEQRPLRAALVARAQITETLAAYPVGTLDSALTAPVPAPVAARHEETPRPFHLPRPDRWTAVLATLALAAFFFLRRIV